MSNMKRILGEVHFEEMEEIIREKGIAEGHIYLTKKAMELGIDEAYDIWLEVEGRKLAAKWLKLHEDLLTEDDVELGRYLSKKFLTWVIKEHI